MAVIISLHFLLNLEIQFEKPELQNWIKMLIKSGAFRNPLINFSSTKTSMKKQNKQEFSPSKDHNSNNNFKAYSKWRGNKTLKKKSQILIISKARKIMKSDHKKHFEKVDEKR
jgi:hypothetical protein